MQEMKLSETSQSYRPAVHSTIQSVRASGDTGTSVIVVENSSYLKKERSGREAGKI